MFYNFFFHKLFTCHVMKNGFVVGILFIFCLINCYSGQMPPTKSNSDLTMFINAFFSVNNSVYAPSTPSPLPSNTVTEEDVVMDYDELVGSIFYQNASLNEPDAIVVSVTIYLSRKIKKSIIYYYCLCFVRCAAV